MAHLRRADVDKEALRTVFPQLVEGLQANDIIDDLYKKHLLENDELKDINDGLSNKDSKAVNRDLLMMVGRRPAGFARNLVEILSEKPKYSSLADLLEKGR